jgi:geranylgeranyl transferase type-2 subunit alpha
LKEELEIVINAAFTDPNDSSAWFYQRWLLGYSEQKFNIACFKLTKNQAVISFTKPIDIVKDNVIIVMNSEQENDSSSWRSLSGEKSDWIWIQKGVFELSDNFTIEVRRNECFYSMKTRRVNEEQLIAFNIPTFGYEFGAAVKEELKNQLDSCNQLLEYEPDSKWTLLTAALLMRSLDRFKFHDETLLFIRKLEKVDTMRTGYYRDLASKWIIEKKLIEWLQDENFSSFNLSSLELTSIYYNQYLILANSIDLNGNPNLNFKTCKFALLDGCDLIS